MDACLECDTTEGDLYEVTVTARDKDDEVISEERHPICKPCADAMTKAAWGQPGIESEITYETHDGEIRRIGFDGETVYVPVDLPEDASMDEIATVMQDAAKQLGFS